MTLDLKILACVTFGLVMVQGRAGGPSSLCRELLLKALAKLREKSNYSPINEEITRYYERNEEIVPTDDPFTEEVEDNINAFENRDVKLQVFEGLKIIIGPNCSETFVKAIEESLQDDVHETAGGTDEETEEERRYQERYESVPDTKTLLAKIINGLSAAFNCLDESNDDEATNSDGNDDEPESFGINDNESEIDDTPDTGSTDEEAKAKESKSSSEESVEGREEEDVTKIVERELLKDLLKKRISELSKYGPSGGKK